jgi:VWFA-related protein
MFRIPAFLALAAVNLLAVENPPAVQQPADPKPEGPSYTFRSDVSLARVDVQVVDRDNRPIRGLRAEDFVLREDGKQCDIRQFQSEQMPIDVLLLLDVSRSMEPHVQRIASASHRALSALGDQDRVAIMVFDRATRVRMPFRAGRKDAERELANVLDDESFRGGTDITRGLLDAADYMTEHARRDARRAIVILTDDQTERNRNEAGVLRALDRAECVLSALIAPDALHTGDRSNMRSPFDDDDLRELFGNRLPGFGPRTQSAGTSRIAKQSGGDSMKVDDASAFENTLARIRERYALYFYLPEGVQPGDARSVEVELTEAARRRYPDAEVHYRRSYLKPDGSRDSKEPVDTRPVRVSFPAPAAPSSSRESSGSWLGRA